MSSRRRVLRPRAVWKQVGAALILLLGPGAARGAEQPPVPATRGGGERVDAELLRDLDVLASPDYARDREVAGSVRVIERLRMLEMLRLLDGHPAQIAAPARPIRTPKEAH